ncbi:MAG: hypothetical protein V4681_00375 [Patescibacteria group bacterium]
MRLRALLGVPSIAIIATIAFGGTASAKCFKSFSGNMSKDCSKSIAAPAAPTAYAAHPRQLAFTESPIEHASPAPAATMRSSGITPLEEYRISESSTTPTSYAPSYREPPSQAYPEPVRVANDYRGYNRGGYGSNASNIGCGFDLRSNMCQTPDGRDYGYSGQRDYGYGRYGSSGSRFYGGIVWPFPYKEYGNQCPPAPPNTQAPRGYKWHCERMLTVQYGGYVVKGSEHVKSLAITAGVLTALAGASR